MHKTFRIAIVGLGAVGSAACIQLLRRIRQAAPAAPVRITCYEKRPDGVGAGLAYGTKHDFHVLNMRSRTMSLFPERPDDFVAWLADRGVAGQEYVSRHLFGAYIKDRFAAVVASHTGPGVELTIVHDEVLDCEELGDEVLISTPGATAVFDAALLSLGHWARKTPRATSCPWTAESYDAIPAAGRVGILGSGLSAVDVILTLEARGFRGPIACVSRQRLLPKVQSDAPPVTAKHLTRAALAALTGGFARKIALADVIPLLRREFLEFPHGERLWRQMFEAPTEDVVAGLEDALAQAEGGRVVWHTILDATTDVVSELWAALDDRAKLRFLRVYEAHWAMFRHSMPLLNAQKLLAVAREGRLTVRRGLKEVRYDESRRVFTLQLRGKDAAARLEVDHLIDATGVNFDLAQTLSPLVDRMRRRGQLVQHPFGGVDVDFTTSRLKFATGETARRLLFVGVQTKGVHFYTNSFEMNRDRVFDAVETLVRAVAAKKDAVAANQRRIPAENRS